MYCNSFIVSQVPIIADHILDFFTIHSICPFQTTTNERKRTLSNIIQYNSSHIHQKPEEPILVVHTHTHTLTFCLVLAHLSVNNLKFEYLDPRIYFANVLLSALATAPLPDRRYVLGVVGTPVFACVHCHPERNETK